MRYNQKTHEEFVNEIKETKPNIEIIGEYINCKTKIACKCKICEHIWYPSPDSLRGCPVCSGRVPKIGVSDLWTTHPHIANQLKDKELGYSIMAGSSREVIFICPICNTEVKSRVNRWINGEKKCPKCNDKISYPEKFIFNLLEQLLKSDFNYQITYKWAKDKRYDFSLLYDSCIIETHGRQHYEDKGFYTYCGDSLEQEQENDIQKEQLAKKNGIKHYIALDCRYSTLEWIKKSVLESELPTLLNFTENDINWDECHQNSLKS